MSNPDALVEAYTQAFETMRYYGNLRFTVLTAFILMSGGLFTAALRPTKGLTMSFRLASFAGILLAIVFGTFEWRIAANFDFYGSKTEQIGRLLQMNEDIVSRPSASNTWRWVASVFVLTIYVGAGIMWLTLVWHKWKGESRVHRTNAPNKLTEAVSNPPKIE
jgi:hypothetical protein